MSTTSAGPIGKRLGAFTETTIDDETVVMSLESGDFFSLAGTAGAIWGMIDGVRDRDSLCAALAAAYAADPAEIAADLDAFLAELADAGLIDRA